jgi:hypothetical protein
MIHVETEMRIKVVTAKHTFRYGCYNLRTMSVFDVFVDCSSSRLNKVALVLLSERLLSDDDIELIE